MEYDAGQRSALIESIAAACYQQNRLYSELAHEQLGVPVLPPWLEVDDETKDMYIAGVMAALEDPSPARNHERWMTTMRELGWTHGSIKDPSRKTHPCLIPWSDLPESQKRKDVLFVEMVQQLGRTSGLLTINGSET